MMVSMGASRWVDGLEKSTSTSTISVTETRSVVSEIPLLHMHRVLSSEKVSDESWGFGPPSGRPSLVSLREPSSEGSDFVQDLADFEIGTGIPPSAHTGCIEGYAQGGPHPKHRFRLKLICRLL